MLLLFDIDGTLLRGAAESHARALRRALHEVYDVGDRAGEPEALPQVAAAGRTDLEIAREMLLLCGRSARRIDEGLERLREACVRHYALCGPEDLRHCVIEGMHELLAWLSTIADVKLALLTGNLEPIARAKLARAGLGHYFAAGQGAFGSDSEDRTDLPAIARERAGAASESYPRAGTLVIGDTPRDIACARADSVRCLAVSTGSYTPEQLVGADGVAGGTVQLRALLERELGLCDGRPAGRLGSAP